jgi:nitroreductase
MRDAPTTRRFREAPVDSAAIKRVLDNARFAPSGGNRQGWRLVLVDDPQLRRALRDLYLPGWRAYMEQTGGAAALRAADAGELEDGRISALRRANEYAERLDEVPLTSSSGSTCRHWRSSIATSSGRASSAAPRSIRSCRTCCSACATRRSAPRSRRC